MATYNKIQQFVEDIANKVHDLSSDQLIVALSNTAILVTNSVLADLTEIVYTNLSSRNITTTSSTQTTGTYSLVLVDVVLTASAAVPTFQFVAIYNDAPASPLDPLICFFNAASPVTLATDETFTINFGSALFNLA